MNDPRSKVKSSVSEISEKTALSFEHTNEEQIQILDEAVPAAVFHLTRLNGGTLNRAEIIVPGNSTVMEFGVVEDYEEEPHRHNAFMLILVLHSTIFHKVGAHTFRLDAGQACFINRNVANAIRYEPDAEVAFVFLQQSFLLKALSVQKFFPEAGKGMVLRLQSFIANEREEGDETDRIYYDFTPAESEHSVLSSVRTSVERLEKNLLENEAGMPFHFIGILFSLLSLFWSSERYYYTRVSVSSDQKNALANKVKQLIEAKHGVTGRAELSALLHYNGEYLNLVTKQTYRQTISQLCMDCKLQHFAKQLKESSQTIDSLLTVLEITNRTHFFALFRTRYGTTPLKYRQNTAKREDSR